MTCNGDKNSMQGKDAHSEIHCMQSFSGGSLENDLQS